MFSIILTTKSEKTIHRVSNIMGLKEWSYIALHMYTILKCFSSIYISGHFSCKQRMCSTSIARQSTDDVSSSSCHRPIASSQSCYHFIDSIIPKWCECQLCFPIQILLHTKKLQLLIIWKLSRLVN